MAQGITSQSAAGLRDVMQSMPEALTTTPDKVTPERERSMMGVSRQAQGGGKEPIPALSPQSGPQALSGAPAPAAADEPVAKGKPAGFSAPSSFSARPEVILPEGKGSEALPSDGKEPEALSSYQKTPESADRAGQGLAVWVYVQDPYVAELLPEGRCLYSFLPSALGLGHGPTTSRIAVVDWDADQVRLEPPARWDSGRSCFYFHHKGERVPITREDRNLAQFHQINVWAVIQRVLEYYQEAWVLGRAAPWAFEGNRLIALPHAGYMENAFYDRRSKSIQFYYFDGHHGRIHTCLSHDIIAHETGHAILDGIRPLYDEDSSLQTTAFHEFVADLTAIITALHNDQLRSAIARESGGDLSRDTVLSSLAEEFGLEETGLPSLRSAQKRVTMQDATTSDSPHELSQVLTGAMFEILTNMASAYYKQEEKRVSQGRTEGLLDEERQGIAGNALRRAAKRFRRTALQPLDYLPPVDVQFRDYACAVLRADEVADPADRNGFRSMMRRVFRSRKIVLGKEDLPGWSTFSPFDIDELARSRTDAYHFLNENRRLLRIPPSQDISVAELYRTNKMDADGNRLAQEVVVQYIWREDVPLVGTDFGSLDGETTTLLCGGTLVFDGRGNLLHWTRKPGTGRLGPEWGDEDAQGRIRQQALKDYVKKRVALGRVGPVERGDSGELAPRSPLAATRAGDRTLRIRVLPRRRHSGGS